MGSSPCRFVVHFLLGGSSLSVLARNRAQSAILHILARRWGSHRPGIPLQIRERDRARFSPVVFVGGAEIPGRTEETQFLYPARLLCAVPRAPDPLESSPLLARLGSIDQPSPSKCTLHDQVFALGRILFHPTRPLFSSPSNRFPCSPLWLN